MSYILPLNEATTDQIDQVGGKAANLGQLIRFGFNTPDGFVVTADAYRDFLGSTRVDHAPDGEAALPDELVAAIAASVADYPADQAFAVRSSGTLEDLDGSAFAGLHDTFLNVRGAQRIQERVRDCFLSLWSERAVAYREERGFDHRQAAMAVVVQPLIPCDRAGVAFTVNPVSGNLGEMMVDANFGLGESVVGGESEVDNFVIDKATLAVVTSSAGGGRKVVLSGNDGTREEAPDDSTAAGVCLDADALRQLAALALKVEEAFGFPQDIEWGFAAGTLFVLQSRAITAIPPRWTRDEAAERFPIAMTPLTWDFVEDGFHRSLKYSFKLMGFPSFNGKWFMMHDHYIYGNQNAVRLYCWRPPFKVESLSELAAMLPKLRTEFRWVQELPIAWSRNLDNHLIQVGQFMAESHETRSNQEIWDFVHRVNAHGARYFLPNIAISITQSRLFHQLNQLLKLAIGESDAARLLGELTGHCETKTGMINAEIHQLTLLIRAEPQLESLIRTEPSRSIISDNQLEAFAGFHQRFQEFLRDHGHREMEFDAYYPTWIDAPWVVLDLLKQMLQHDNLEHPADKERTLKIKQQLAEQELFELLPAEFHFFFFEALRLTREYTRIDDLEHYHTTRLTLLIRRALIELGGRLCDRGILDDARDLFFAHEAQITNALAVDSEASWAEFRELVQMQKAAYLRDKARTPDWILGETAAAIPPDAKLLCGTPGSHGSVEGEVFMMDSSDDFADFPQGAVLVARTTNPSWTPVFYSAAAVVTESGGPLSHGAVTAREVGIPAVMSVRGVMQALRNGQRVRVNGTSGKVILL